MQREVEHKQNGTMTILRKLPSALINKKNDPEAWETLHQLLCPDQTNHCNNNINKKYICPMTRRLMFDPVRDNNSKTVYEREAFVSAYPRIPLMEALDIRHEINALLFNNSFLECSRYLPLGLIKQTSVACSQGNQAVLREMVQRDGRLLVTPDLVTASSPIFHAIEGEHALDALIELLDRYEEGLALACLLHPHPNTGQLPLEHALRHGSSLMTVLKLMAWMGDSLASFELTRPLSQEAQSTLNDLLLVYVLRGDAASVAKVISWGADINAALTQNMSLDVIFSLADRQVIAILLRKIAGNNDNFVPFHEKKPAHSETKYTNPFELHILEDKAADSKTQMGLNRDEQISALLKYKNIGMIVETLAKQATNENVPCSNEFKNFIRQKKPSPLELPCRTLFSMSIFNVPWREPEEETLQKSILKIGYE